MNEGVEVKVPSSYEGTSQPQPEMVHWTKPESAPMKEYGTEIWVGVVNETDYPTIICIHPRTSSKHANLNGRTWWR